MTCLDCGYKILIPIAEGKTWKGFYCAKCHRVHVKYNNGAWKLFGRHTNE